MATEQLIDELLNHMETLPEIPSVAFKVNRLLDDPDADANDLAEVIMMDPALTAQVLRICNSAQYGFSRKIGTIKEAVAILGHKLLKHVIFTIISHGMLNRPIEGYALEKGALWDNALTCAAYARYIANKAEYPDPDLAFVAALLRDIGKIALESKTRGHMEALEEVALQKNSSFVEAEMQVVGLSHVTIGYHLALRWNLPDSLVNVIRYHHRPSDAPAELKESELKLISIVHLADIFTMLSGAGLGIDGLMYPLDPVAFSHLNFKADNAVMEAFFSELLELREEIHAMAQALVSQK